MNEHNEKKAYIPPTMEVLKMDYTKVLLGSCRVFGENKDGAVECFDDRTFD